MSILLIFGLIMGIRHALEPDHMAAVMVLSSKPRSLSATAKQGAIWGAGHTTTLFIFSLMLMGLQIELDKSVFIIIEVAAGLFIVLMGLDVIIKTKSLYGERENKEDYTIAKTRNNATLSFKAFGIGLLHGAAGSGIIIALVSTTLDSIYLKFIYIALFSIGLILSMSLLSILMSVPLNRGISILPTRHLKFATGTLAILIGMKIIYEFSSQITTLNT